jgi:hypothetical protein
VNEPKIPKLKVSRWPYCDVVDLSLKVLVDFLLWWLAAWLMISSLNTLFPALSIPHTFWTYGSLWAIVTFTKIVAKL